MGEVWYRGKLYKTRPLSELIEALDRASYCDFCREAYDGEKEGDTCRNCGAIVKGWTERLKD